MEAWRFTDLRGLRPRRFVRTGPGPDPGRGRRRPCSTSTWPPMATVRRAGIEIDARAGRDHASSRSDERTSGSARSSAADDKFTAHNAAAWKHGLLVRVPRGVELEQAALRARSPTRSTAARSSGVCSSSPRRAPLHADRGVRLGLARPRRATRTRVVELFVEQGAKLEYVSLQNLSRETWHFATHHARVERDAELDWVAGGFGSKKGKVRIQNDLAGPGATSRVTGAYFADGDAAPRLRHLPGAHRARHTTSDFAFKGALRDAGDGRSGAG